MAKPQILVDISNIKESINILFKKIIKGTGQIPNTPASWTDIIGGTYKKRYFFTIQGVTSSDVVDIALDKDSVDIAINADMCPTTESDDGGVYIYTKTIPANIITFNYIVFK